MRHDLVGSPRSLMTPMATMSPVTLLDVKNGRRMSWGDRRERGLRMWELHEAGISVEDIAARFDVDKSAVYGWIRRIREGKEELIRLRGEEA